MTPLLETHSHLSEGASVPRPPFLTEEMPALEKEDPTLSRKPRPWNSIKRHATTLTSQLLQRRTSPRKPRIATQAEFRRNFLRITRDRIIKDAKGDTFRMYPIIMNGDCGFASIANSINIEREKMKIPTPPPRSGRIKRIFWFLQTTPPPEKRTLQAKDVRMAMLGEIRRAKKTYLSDEKYQSFYTQEVLDRLIQRLEREVSRQGIGGHWLGTVLDQLEYIILAHAMNINIFLYQFDLKSQSVVQFDSALVSNPDYNVFLFFTGPPGCGHFDTLIKIADSTRRYTNRGMHPAALDDASVLNDVTKVNSVTMVNGATAADDTISVNDISINDAATMLSE